MLGFGSWIMLILTGLGFGSWIMLILTGHHVMDHGAPHRVFRSRVKLLHVAFEGVGYVASHSVSGHSLDVLPDGRDPQL